MAEPIVDVAYLKKSYGTIQAVSDVTFRIERGEFFGLLGPNGAGKTTTIAMLVGLVRPTSGRLTIDGLDPRHRPEWRQGETGSSAARFCFLPHALCARKPCIFRQDLWVVGRLGLKRVYVRCSTRCNSPTEPTRPFLRFRTA